VRLAWAFVRAGKSRVCCEKKSVTELSTAYPIRNMRDILQQTKLPVNIFKVVAKRFFADVGELKASDCRILLAEQINKSVWFMR